MAEVHVRISSDPTISVYYNLTEMLTEGSSSNARFMQEVFYLLGISS